MHACVYIGTYVCMYVSVYVCMYVCMHYVCTYVCMYIDRQINIDIFAYLFTVISASELLLWKTIFPRLTLHQQRYICIFIIL